MYEPTDDNVFEVVGRDLDEWKYFDPDAQKMMPINIPQSLGYYVVIKADVDANYVENMATRRSHSGIIIHVNNATIIWYSKLENTVEASSFGSKFVAIRIATEII